ncbi:hypothetical protein ASZ90_001176 [hydrocarbon metagenome]|uniref:Uncharacterized protein n=1 Tax=hydrocarbon metagenome TaxID=938273 RepID=A0A0W8G738_9ZZZZ
MLSEDTKWSVLAQNARGDDSTLAELQTILAEKHFAMKQAMVRIPDPAPADPADPAGAVGLAAYLHSGRGALAESVA